MPQENIFAMKIIHFSLYNSLEYIFIYKVNHTFYFCTHLVLIFWFAVQIKIISSNFLLHLRNTKKNYLFITPKIQVVIQSSKGEQTWCIKLDIKNQPPIYKIINSWRFYITYFMRENKKSEIALDIIFILLNVATSCFVMDNFMVCNKLFHATSFLFDWTKIKNNPSSFFY